METSTGEDNDLHESSDSLRHLLDRAQQLLNELKLFQTALRNHAKQHESEIRVFRRGIQSEVKCLETIQRRTNDQLPNEDGHDDEQKQSRYTHAIKSSNLPFYEAVWKTAKINRQIIGLGRRVYFGPRTEDAREKQQSQANNRRSAVVDIVADSGLKWIKVSTINNKRLLFEMAKQGWENYGDYSSDEHDSCDGSPSVRETNNSGNELEIIKVAKALVAAARTQRVNFQHPKVHIVLPNVCEGEYDDIDTLLHDLRATSVLVTASSIADDIENRSEHDLKLSTDNVVALLPDPHSHLQLSRVLNVDCTILLALVSDISHISQAELPPYPTNKSGTYHKAILRQIEGEKDLPLLPNELYNIFHNRQLQCTSYAAERMFKIVHTMGTDQEKERAAIFFGQDKYANQTSQQLQKRLAEVSCHSVPETLTLPISIIDFKDLSPPQMSPLNLDGLKLSESNQVETTTDTEQMTPLDTMIAHKLTQILPLSAINTSVFLYGWSRNLTTVTSNKVVASSINKTINELLDELEQSEQHESKVYTEQMSKFTGPRMYICETARSLIGKEKQQIS